jgi:transcriptional regulatory protein RtcR
VSLAQQESFLPDRVELLHDPQHAALAKQVLADITHCAPSCQANGHAMQQKLDPWDFASVYAMLYDFARRYPFKPEREDYYIHITTGSHVAQICLFLLAETRHFPAKLIQTSPPPKNVRKATPGSLEVIDLDLSRYDALKTRFAEEAVDAATQLKSGIPTKNEAYNALIVQLTKVATATRDPILLTGPTGAGKSMLAERIYELRQQKGLVSAKFVQVNCATLRGDVAMSTLFGHVKGAFTGAMHERAGLLKEAHQGLLFLDEIGELGVDEQALLLRALEDKAFYPFGGDKLTKSDFQLVCGTNRDLEIAVREGRFREDLLARINLWTYAIPGLAQRREDIGPNVDYELEKFASATGRKVSFNKEAREAFLRFARHPDSTWRGNFRDLSASITRLATLAPRGRVTAEQVAEETAQLSRRWQKLSGDTATETLAAQDLLANFFTADQLNEIDLIDQVQLAAVLQCCRKSRSLAEAGRQLYAASRKQRSQANDSDRVRKFLAKYGLTWEQITG